MASDMAPLQGIGGFLDLTPMMPVVDGPPKQGSIWMGFNDCPFMRIIFGSGA